MIVKNCKKYGKLEDENLKNIFSEIKS